MSWRPQSSSRRGRGAKVFPPSAEQKAEIHKKLAELSARIAALGSNKKTDPALLADIQIYRKAADYILRFPEEFFGAELRRRNHHRARYRDRALHRARNGTSSWTKKDGQRRARLHVTDRRQCPAVRLDDSGVLRRQAANAPRHLAARHAAADERSAGTLPQQASPRETSQILADDYIMVEPFARMNHSYKFYAETDVYEVIAAVRKHYNIDAERIVIRGHSMGGHRRLGRGSLFRTPRSSARTKRAPVIPRRRNMRAIACQRKASRLTRKRRCTMSTQRTTR